VLPRVTKGSRQPKVSIMRIIYLNVYLHCSSDWGGTPSKMLNHFETRVQQQAIEVRTLGVLDRLWLQILSLNVSASEGNRSVQGEHRMQ
jgi:hypothetical protein